MISRIKLALFAILLIGVTCFVTFGYLLLREYARQATPTGPCRICYEIQRRDTEQRWSDPFDVDPSLASLVCRHGPGEGGWANYTPLHTAAMCADPIALLAILDSGADPNFQFVDAEIGAFVDRTPLMAMLDEDTSSYGSRAEECMRLLLDRGASIDARDRNRRTALHYARNSIAKARIVVNHAADLDAVDDQGDTALHLAAKHIRNGEVVEVVSLLIEAGADLSIKNLRGQTALELCNTPEKRAAFEKAMEQRHGLPPRGRLVPQGTALHAALAAGDQSLFRELLANGGDPNELNSAGDSVVHLAAEMEDGFWLDESLKSGGNPDVLNTGNRTAPDSTPLFYAIRALHRNNVQRLIGAGADVNHRDHYGTTPLFAAMLRVRYDIATTLVQAGADPRLKIANGATAMNYWDFFHEQREQLINDLGRRNDYVELKTLLKSKGYLTQKDLACPYWGHAK